MILRIDDLTKAFGGLVALDSVSMAVPEGQIRGIIGPNGSGKSTLINCVSGVYVPTRGAITFRDQPIQGLPPHVITSRGVARTFQNIRLFDSLSVIHNVAMACHCRTQLTIFDVAMASRRAAHAESSMRQRAMRSLRQVNMVDRAGWQASSLSYGQRRMVEIARALATEPKLILLDEPCAGLSQTEANQLADQIRRIREYGITVVLIEHNMRFVMNLCEYITVLDQGKKIAEGTPGEIRANPRVIEAYLGGGSGNAQA